MDEVIITKNDSGQRLDKYLHKYLPAAPRGFLCKMLRKKNIVLNSGRASGREILSPGDQVTFFLSRETIDKFSASEKNQEVIAPDINPEIIFEDEHILLVNKPPGILSQRTRPEDLSMVEIIRNYLIKTGKTGPEELRTFSPGICNRLDRNTSGMLIAGKTLRGLQNMSQFLKARTVEKYYLCLVGGKVTNICRQEAYLSKDKKTNIVSISQETGEYRIETAFEPMAWNERLSLLKVHLMTGRPHQIRAHLAYMGYPIAGDRKYGSQSLNRWLKTTYGCNRQLLHSYELIFPPHMEDTAAILSGRRFTAKLPEDFYRVIREETWQHGAQGALEVLH